MTSFRYVYHVRSDNNYFKNLLSIHYSQESKSIVSTCLILVRFNVCLQNIKINHLARRSFRRHLLSLHDSIEPISSEISKQYLYTNAIVINQETHILLENPDSIVNDIIVTFTEFHRNRNLFHSCTSLHFSSSHFK